MPYFWRLPKRRPYRSSDWFQQQKRWGVSDKQGHCGSHILHQDSDKEANNANMFTLLNGISRQSFDHCLSKTEEEAEHGFQGLAHGFILAVSKL